MKQKNIRLYVQIFFFVLVASIAINHLLAESGNGIPILSSASMHALCPFGGVVSIYQFVVDGTFVQKIKASAFILMIISLFLAIGFGPVVCGWMCPLGSVQEWFGKIGKKLFGRRYNTFVPKKYDKYLRYLRYVVLIWVVYVTAVTGKLIFQDYDPYYALFNFYTGEVAIGSLFILGLTILLSLLVERPWCKYACPYGAFLGITNLFRVFKIKRNEPTCISCSRCDKVCPMNIEVSKVDVVRNHQCISCMKCTSEQECPVEETVIHSTNFKRRNTKISNTLLASLIVVFLFGGVAVTAATNLWTTSSDRTPSRIDGGEFAGEMDPASIKGSHSFGEISEFFEVSLEDLRYAFHLPSDADPEFFKNNQLEGLYLIEDIEIGTESVKYFVALYTGLPYVIEEEVYLPENAVEVLINEERLSAEQIEYFETHTIYLSEADVVDSLGDIVEDEEHTTSNIVNGKTTFGELLSMGVDESFVEELIGQSIPSHSTVISTFCSENGLSFSSIKVELQEEVDKINN